MKIKRKTTQIQSFNKTKHIQKKGGWVDMEEHRRLREIQIFFFFFLSVMVCDRIIREAFEGETES